MTKTEIPTLPQTGLVRAAHILPVLHITKSTLYRWIEEGKFPQAFKIGQAAVWRAETVHAWLDEYAPVFVGNRTIVKS